MGLKTDSEKCGLMEVAELLLTAEIYSRSGDLTEDDLPPAIRKHYFDAATRSVKRPIYVTSSDVLQIYGIDNIKAAIKDLPFVSFEEFGSQLKLTVFDIAAKWFANQKDLARSRSNPTLAYFYENYDSLDVSYAEAKNCNKPLCADREWIESRIKELCKDPKESEDLLKLAYIKAPEDVRDSISGLVLTDDQKSEIEKTGKALANREYLGEIGLYEIGKLLFVGPPGTGKTSTARALSSWFSLPIVEVRLARRKRKKLTVVFDGSPEAGRPKVQSFGDVTVVYAAPRSADEEIVRRIREARDPRGVTVVTDDRALLSAVAGAGARTAGIDAFFRDASARLSRRPDDEAEKSAPPIGLADWERWFSDPRNRLG